MGHKKQINTRTYIEEHPFLKRDAINMIDLTLGRGCASAYTHLLSFL